MLLRFLCAFVLCAVFFPAKAQFPLVFKNDDGPSVRETSLTRKYLTPIRAVWTSGPDGQFVQHVESILTPGNGQGDLNQGKYLTLVSTKEVKPGIICHGWTSGPTSWLTQYVLGVNVLEPGCKKISVEPHLGDLEWVEGTFPTPYGIVKIEHRRLDNGKIKTTFKAPKEVKIN